MLELGKIEQTIGYEFKNKDLLQQAFVRKSYSAENGGQNNEVLEFIGDKALDLVVIRIMMDQFGVIAEDRDYSEFKPHKPKYFQTKYGEGKFTEIKANFVKGKTLSQAIETLELQNYLIMGKGDVKHNLQNNASVREDLFEAIIGAVTLDSDWNIEILCDVVENMFRYTSHFLNINEELENSQNFVGLVQEWFQINEKKLPQYQYIGGTEQTVGEPFDNSLENGEGLYKCQLYFENKYFNGYGNNNAEAREKCAELFYKWLQKNGRLIAPIIRAIGIPNEREAIRQLNELYQKKLISKPSYCFHFGHNTSGRSVWGCECIIEEWDKVFECADYSQREAQRMSAYEALLYLMGMQESDETNA